MRRRGEREPGAKSHRPFRPWWRFCINVYRRPLEDFEQGREVYTVTFPGGPEVDDMTLVRGLS